MHLDVPTRFVKLPKGGTLELQATPEFYDRVRKQFSLSAFEEVSDDHVRMFVYGAVKNAVDKAESASDNG